MSRAVARRRSGMSHLVEVDGHELIVDELPEDGGNDEGMRPTRMLAAPLASCTAITMAMYADRKEWDIEGLEVAVDFDGHPGSWRQGRLQGRGHASRRTRRGAARAHHGHRRQMPRPQDPRRRSRDRVAGSRRGELMDLGLDGRACVVTGAGRGIGRATARTALRGGRPGAARRPHADRGRRGRRRMRSCRSRRQRPSRPPRHRRNRADAGQRILAEADRPLRRPRRDRQQRGHRDLARSRRRPRRRTGTRPGSST